MLFRSYLPCLNSDKQKIAEVRVKDPMVKTDEHFIPEWVMARPKTEVCEADPATLEAALNKERTAAAYENLCRLYVGMTRAVRRLVLVHGDQVQLAVVHAAFGAQRIGKVLQVPSAAAGNYGNGYRIADGAG